MGAAGARFASRTIVPALVGVIGGGIGAAVGASLTSPPIEINGPKIDLDIQRDQ